MYKTINVNNRIIRTSFFILFETKELILQFQIIIILNNWAKSPAEYHFAILQRHIPLANYHFASFDYNIPLTEY